DKIKTIPVYEANNPLVVGKAMGIGIEKSIEEGIKYYYKSFPIINEAHITEAIKLEYWIPKVQELIPLNSNFEVEVKTQDFIGYIDLLVENDDGTFDI